MSCVPCGGLAPPSCPEPTDGNPKLVHMISFDVPNHLEGEQSCCNYPCFSREEAEP